MKTVLLIGLVMLHCSFATAQTTVPTTPPSTSNPQVIVVPMVITPTKEEKKEAAKPQKTDIPFGKQFDYNVTLSGKDNYIYKVVLKRLDRKYSKQYYNTNNTNLFKDNSVVAFDTEITWSSSDNKTFTFKIPPLKANEFYQLKIHYFKAYDNIYATFLKMHEEGNENWYYEKKKWMTMIEKISDLNRSNKLIYIPTIEELNDYDDAINEILAGDDFNLLTLEKQHQIRNLTYEKFPILNFKRPEDYLVHNYAKFAVGSSRDALDEKNQVDKFSNVFSSDGHWYINFINIYAFYSNYLKEALVNNDRIKDQNRKNGKADEDDQELSIYEIIELVNLSIIKERDKFQKGLIPNYLNYFEVLVATTSMGLTTHSESFETSYKRSLVPDFGLIAYRAGSSDAIRGLPYVGVNISLAPVNKDVPLRLSCLSTWQRLSLHTGVTLGSIAEPNRREDFFKDISLMLGGSYKIGTQATRLNFGGLLYNKIDPISGDKSFAITPYVGISIDIEIRKWLSGIIPGYTKNFD